MYYSVLLSPFKIEVMGIRRIFFLIAIYHPVITVNIASLNLRPNVTQE